MVDHSKLNDVLALIRKEYGKEAVQTGNEKSEVKRIPFHDIQLDWATGGGIPMGRWSHFYGPESAGKTALSLKIIAHAQQMGMTAAYYDVEKTFVPSWAEKMGVDVDALHVLRPTIIEDVGVQLEAMMQAVNIHVIDSIPAAVPRDELSGTLDQWHMGLGARTWNKLLRRIQHSIEEDNAIILINQLRTAMAGRVTFEQPTGGKFLRHEAALSLELKKGPRLFYNKHGFLSPEIEKNALNKLDEQPDGIEIVSKTAKSKVGIPLRPARMRLDFQSGQFDELYSLAMFAQFYELVERNGAWYSILGNGTKVQGEAGLRKYISENPDFSTMIREKVI
jgi:recombination protein RecA